MPRQANPSSSTKRHASSTGACGATAPVDPERSLILLGGGGHAKVVTEAARAQGWTVGGFLDDRTDAPLAAFGVPRLGAIADWTRFAERHPLFVAIGDNALRRRLLDELISGLGEDEVDEGAIAAVIDPTAVVSPSARLSIGVLVAPRAVINADAAIDRGAIVNTGAVVEHDCRVGAGAHVAPGAALGGAAVLDDGALVGLGARVLPGARVGANAVVGAGAVVVNDVPDGTTVRGVPAR